MPTRPRFVPASLLLALWLGGSPVLAQASADSASVRDFYRQWFGSVSPGFTSYASFYAEAGYILPPNAAPVVGRAAIAEWMTQTQAANPWIVRPQGVNVDEVRFLNADWVIQRTTLRGERTPKAGGAARPFETKYLDLLHRKPSGGWEVAFRMWSDNLPS